VVGIVKSTPFQMRRVEQGNTVASAKVTPAQQ
jgi:hypothetical protein